MAVGTQVHAHACEQLVERERLREEVAGAELEAAQLRRKVGARGEDQDRKLRPGALQRLQHGEPVELREQQVEDDEVEAIAQAALEAVLAVAASLDAEPFGGEAPDQERLDAGLVLDDEDPHVRATITDAQMTCK
jgi:hypothetical protein